MFEKKGSCLYIFYHCLFFLGFKGFLKFNLKKQNLNCSFFLSNKYFFFVDYISKKIKKQASISFLKSSLKGVNYFFAKKLILMGIGFRCWTIFSKNNKFIVIKASLSKDIIVHIPSEIDIFCFNNTSLIIFGFKKQNVYLFISKIKKIKKFNVYKKKGVFFENELVKLKIGKKT